jgi:hypothetical protein
MNLRRISGSSRITPTRPTARRANSAQEHCPRKTRIGQPNPLCGDTCRWYSTMISAATARLILPSRLRIPHSAFIILHSAFATAIIPPPCSRA